MDPAADEWHALAAAAAPGGTLERARVAQIALRARYATFDALNAAFEALEQAGFRVFARELPMAPCAVFATEPKSRVVRDECEFALTRLEPAAGMGFG